MPLPPKPMVPRVYPRVCGGTYIIANNADDSDGLSPRVRGNRAGAPEPVDISRSIPACAGNLVVDCQAYRLVGSIPACAGEPA